VERKSACFIGYHRQEEILKETVAYCLFLLDPARGCGRLWMDFSVKLFQGPAGK
jgi:hypothetical protein